MLKQLGQGVLAGQVLSGQGVEAVHGAVRPLPLPRGGAGLGPRGPGLLRPSVGHVVPWEEGDEGIQPHQEMNGEQQDGVQS